MRPTRYNILSVLRALRALSALSTIVLTAAAALSLAGCAATADDEPAGAFGKADGFGSDTRGPGCQTTDGASYGYLVAKLHDHLGVAMDETGRFEITAPLSPATERGLNRALEDVIATLGEFGRETRDVRMMFRGSALASAPSSAGLAEVGPDLGAYYQISVADLDDGQITALCSELGTSSIVELAYPQPRPSLALAADGISLVNDDRYRPFYTDYLASSAEGGFGLAPVRALPGSRGEGVRIVDLEFGAALGHEDFPTVEFVAGDPDAFNDHGTAVLGIIGAQSNEFGSEGLVPAATLGASAFTFQNEPDFTLTVAELIAQSAEWAGPGGIVLIEMHALGTTSVADCNSNCNPGQCNFVPMEYFPAIFDAIAAATASGVHVVEAAGNGAVDLDRALPDRRLRDSGAILVGASLSTARSPACFSNHGEAVDVHGWGENVVTTGYGNHPAHADFPTTSRDDSYTHTFSGTSSASPLVVGSAASVLGLAREQLGEDLRPADLRSLLTRSGARQTSTSPPDHPERFFLIGPQPDVERAWEHVQTLVPIASFSHSPGPGTVIEFTNNSSARSAAADAEIVAVSWDFGDGNSSSAFAPVHSYLAAGDYRVVLSVFARGGDVRTTAETVSVASTTTSMERDEAVIELVNTASLQVLDDEVPLASDAARNLVELRPFSTIAEILAVPRVGPASLEKIYEFAN